jgi:hypothetical protein
MNSKDSAADLVGEVFDLGQTVEAMNNLIKGGLLSCKRNGRVISQLNLNDVLTPSNDVRCTWPKFPRRAVLKVDEYTEHLNRVISVGDPRVVGRWYHLSDPHHSFPLSDPLKVRPDALFLPSGAVRSDGKINEDYVNCQAVLMGAEIKTKTLPDAIKAALRYARTINRVQYWRRFIVGFAFTLDRFCCFRADQSGVEMLRRNVLGIAGAVDFVRLLIGLSLLKEVQLGFDPRFTLHTTEEKWFPSQSPQDLEALIQEIASLQVSESDSEGDSIPAESGSVSAESDSIPAESDSIPAESNSTGNPPLRRSSPKTILKEKARWQSGTKEDAVRKAVQKSYTIFKPVSIKLNELDGPYEILSLLFNSRGLVGRGGHVISVKNTKDNKVYALKRHWTDCSRIGVSDEFVLHGIASQHKLRHALYASK